jgi:hypothetical protein
MSRWGTMDGVADLPERAFSENKYTRTFEGGGGGSRSAPSPTYGPGITPAQSQALATVSGGSAAPTAIPTTAAQPYSAAAMGTNNPFQQASSAQQAALAGTAGAGTIANQTSAANVGQYMNPYTTQVINAQNADIMRGAQMGLNELGRQATAAGSFGGSRHGVAMSELGRGAAQLMGQQSAQLRQQGFQNAQAMAQQDIQNRMSQAQQMAGLGQQSFGYGQSVNQAMQQQGAQQQAMQQALMDAAKAQFQGYQSQPVTSLGFLSSALGATPVATNTQTTKQPGLFDYLTLAASTFGGGK